MHLYQLILWIEPERKDYLTIHVLSHGHGEPILVSHACNSSTWQREVVLRQSYEIRACLGCVERSYQDCDRKDGRKKTEMKTTETTREKREKGTNGDVQFYLKSQSWKVTVRVQTFATWYWGPNFEGGGF